MDWVIVICYLARACPTTAFLPQAINIVQTKQDQRSFPGRYSILTPGVTLWCVYGLIHQDWPLVNANLVTPVLTGWIFSLKVRYGEGADRITFIVERQSDSGGHELPTRLRLFPSLGAKYDSG